MEVGQVGIAALEPLAQELALPGVTVELDGDGLGVHARVRRQVVDPLSNGCCRWSLRGVLTLTGSKQSFFGAGRIGPNGGLARCFSHQGELNLAPVGRPLP